MASSAACECGAEEQTVDHVVLQCPIHRPLYGLHGLPFLNDEKIEWLLNTCTNFWCGQTTAVVSTTRSSLALCESYPLESQDFRNFHSECRVKIRNINTC